MDPHPENAAPGPTEGVHGNGPNHWRESLRQQQLLHSLWRDTSPDALQSLLGGALTTQRSPLRGWQTYVANAHAGAERALASSFPTLQQLIGEASFAALARAYWHTRPPERGDLAWLGRDLPDFIATSDQLRSEPYLADVARLEWALSRCESASDPAADLASLALLAGEDGQGADPTRLRLHLMPGIALVSSPYPVASIWQVHQTPEITDSHSPDRFATVREAFAQGRAEHALVWRQGWRAQVCSLPAADAAFVEALLAGQSLDAAIKSASATLTSEALVWEFESWLLMAVPQGWVAGLTAD